MAQRTTPTNRSAIVASRGTATHRRSVGLYNVENGGFATVPSLTAATGTASKWVDGTSAGSSTNDTSRWATQLCFSGGTVEIDPNTNHSGSGGSLLLSTGTTTGTVRAGQVPQTLGTVTLPNFRYLVKVKPNTTYTIQCYCKTSNAVTNAAKLRVFQVKLDGTVSANDSNKLSGTNDWTLLTLSITTASTTYYLQLSAYFDQPGNVAQAWFDDFSITQTSLLPTALSSLANRNVARVAADPESFGANTHSGYTFFQDMLDANLGWARIEMGWKFVEGTQGTYDWSSYDPIIDAAESLGVRPLILLNAPPTWALTTGVLTSDYYDDFANFAIAALNRYAPQGALTYEIFNEVNGSLNYGTFNSDATNYATLLQQTYTAMKAANPDCFILFSGLAASQSGNQYPRTFLDTVYQTIGAGYFDAMNHHPYGWIQAELTDLYTKMQDYGDGDKQIWLTEYGNWNGTAAGAVDLAWQARRARQAIRLKRALPYAGPLFFYDYVDDGTDLTNKEDNYGLTYTDGTHKPVWVAVRDTIANG